MNKGFTLIELLAVILIIISISMLTVVAVTNIVSSSKEKLNNVQKTLIKDTVAMWITDHTRDLATIYENTTCVYITIDNLVNEGYIDSTKDMTTLEDVSGNTKIKITLENNAKYVIDINSSDISGCEKFYE